jgi:hypothetical protein
MKAGPILIILACLLPLCGCDWFEESFDELPAIEWEVYEAEPGGPEANPRIRIKVNTTYKFNPEEGTFFIMIINVPSPSIRTNWCISTGNRFRERGGEGCQWRRFFHYLPAGGDCRQSRGCLYL